MPEPKKKRRPKLDWRIEVMRRALVNGLTIEVEEGAACIAWYEGMAVTNGQGSIEACCRDALDVMWGPTGAMRPDFAARRKEHRQRTPDA